MYHSITIAARIEGTAEISCLHYNGEDAILISVRDPFTVRFILVFGSIFSFLLFFFFRFHSVYRSDYWK